MPAATHVSPVRRDRFIWALISSLIAVVALGATASAATAAGRFALSKTNPPHRICGKPTATRAACFAIAVPTVPASSPQAVGPLVEGSGEKGGFSPADLRSAYNIPESGGSGQTVAVVAAYDYPKANADLKTYREHYKLPECTEANGCFKKVNQAGETKNYPPAESGWAQEMALDIDMVSALCPECKILLVEANSNLFGNLRASEGRAVNLGATVVNNSWGTLDFEGEESSDFLFNLGVPITAAAGDSGYGVAYPAASRYVISVGGTALKKEPKSSRGWTEEVWAGSGGGCSAYELSKPVWQTDTGCAHRTDNDVSAVASPSTPVSIYDTYEHPGWENLGGTSASAPIVAGVEAHASQSTRNLGAEVFYDQPGWQFDVTTGSNGKCAPTYLCTAGVGYDGPTGIGTPNGVPAIRAAEGTSPAVVQDPSTGAQTVYYVNEKQEIAYWNNGSGWTKGVLGGKVASGTSPTAMAVGASQFVYYVNSSGEIATFVLSAGKWVGPTTIGGKVASGTSPTAIHDSNNYQYIYYVNSKSEVAYWAFTTEWIGPLTVGGKVAEKSSLTATINGSNQYIYYANSSNEFTNFTFSGGWIGPTTFGGKIAPGTSPTGVMDLSHNYQYIYYVNSKNEIAYWGFVGEWVPVTIGGKVRENTNLTVTRTGAYQYIYYANSSGEFTNYTFDSAKWIGPTTFGGMMWAKTSPTSLLTPSNNYQYIYYLNPSGGMSDWFWSGGWFGPNSL